MAKGKSGTKISKAAKDAACKRIKRHLRHLQITNFLGFSQERLTYEINSATELFIYSLRIDGAGEKLRRKSRALLETVIWKGVIPSPSITERYLNNLMLSREQTPDPETRDALNDIITMLDSAQTKASTPQFKKRHHKPNREPT